MKRKLGQVLMIVGAILVAACAAQPIKDVNNAPVMRFDGKQLSMADMEHAIRLAAYREEWRADVVSPGHMVAVKRDESGDWTVSVDITYTTSDFSIHYKDSQGMKYDARTHKINRKYKGMVEDLRDRIVDGVQDINPGSN